VGFFSAFLPYRHQKDFAMRLTFSGLVALTLCLGLSLTADPGLAGGPKPKQGKPKFTNRLEKETSPYLLMHAHNPVDWYPWGPEAFAKAKKENKLIFLSIGYSSCYWCHVMERESFANEEVAKLLNKGFVCIKVDREERPDIDQIYMTALQTRGQGGGWPLSMFLSADGRPIGGGTYWPREDKEVDGEKLRGFKTIVTMVHDIWKKDPKGVLKQAEAVAEDTIKALESQAPGRALVALDRKLSEGAVEELKERFDSVHGGFGRLAQGFRGPKFPMPPFLEYALQVGARTKSDELVKMVTLTLDKMAQGGIYDQLGGGFHRYSTERTWTAPHFEKMLYDNAQLAEVYARAYRLTKKPLYRRVLDETLGYVLREMTSPEGGFYSSQDAETHHEEGRFYVWTDQEIDDALPENVENDTFRKVYGAEKGKPNFEGKYHILTQRVPLAKVAESLKMPEAKLAEWLAPVRQKLFEARSRRDRPLRNEVMLTAWSGQMIGGFAEAGRVLKEKKYTGAAARAAAFVLKHQRTEDGRLLRTYGAQPGKAPKAAGAAYLEDYAFLVHGLLNLHDATGDKKWLGEARTLTDAMVEHFGDAKRGGYYFTAHDHEKLFARTKDQYDGAQPSGNSVAVRNLVRLWSATGEERYRAQAEKDFRAFAGSLKAYPQTLTAMLQALDMYLDVREMREKKK
jgi:uncharacterized protein YyaL (SSP411 family)